MSGPGNWAENLKYRAKELHFPSTVEQVRALVSRDKDERVKVLGTRHSFNDIANPSGGIFISLKNLNCIVALNLNADRPTVTVEGGITYGELCRQLYREGYALSNMASLPHISVAGACATATHGSGDRNGNLATAVATMKVITASGNEESFSREQNGEQFLGAVVGLGGLGVVTELTLDIVPAFDVRQEVYENLPLAQLKMHFEEILSSAYSVSLFTDWRNAAFNQVWFKRRVMDGVSFELSPSLHEVTRATRRLHPIAELSAENCTEQMGIRGPAHERLPHFRVDFIPSSGQELQSEYFVPRKHACDAFDAINELCEDVTPLLQISEVRTIAQDNLWMSPCYGRDSVAIHFTWKKQWAAVEKVLPKIEEKLERFNARPHWGKLFTMRYDRVQSLYERIPDFRKLLRSYDPEGKFCNEFLNTYIF